MLKDLIENPQVSVTGPSPDVLSDVLRSIHLSGSLQFCFMPTGNWQTNGEAALKSMRVSGNIIPFHIVVEGGCTMRTASANFPVADGDIVMFPFNTPHDLGSTWEGPLVNPIGDLPPKPWREVPMLRYGKNTERTRILCGFLNCDALNFRPLHAALPEVMHVRTKGANDAAWLRGVLAQMVLEADYPRPGGLSMLERLTEIVFIEVLRHQILSTGADTSGWLAALTDPNLAKCLALIHDAPARNWTVDNLSSASGLSRSTLAERFEEKLGTSPVKYVREWRLCLATTDLASTNKPIAKVADNAGYGTEAAFNRAFSRAYGMPPAAWRQNARRMSAAGGR